MRVLVNRGHNISIRIEIRVMRACFDSWRETRLTEPVEKILFMEPICYVTRMLRIARHINADYECHLCFLGWKNRMHQRRMHSHIGRFVILRRLRAMVSRAFQTLRLFARRRIILMTLGFKVCESNHRSLQICIREDSRAYFDAQDLVNHGPQGSYMVCEVLYEAGALGVAGGCTIAYNLLSRPHWIHCCGTHRQKQKDCFHLRLENDCAKSSAGLSTGA